MEVIFSQTSVFVWNIFYMYLYDLSVSTISENCLFLMSWQQYIVVSPQRNKKYIF